MVVTTRVDLTFTIAPNNLAVLILFETQQMKFVLSGSGVLLLL